MVERSSSPRVISTGSVIPATPRTITPRTSTKRRFFRHSFVSISCPRPQPRHGAHTRASLSSLPMVCGTQHAVPAGSRGARRAFRVDISTSRSLRRREKSADSIFGCGQGLRVTMYSACWGRLASKFRIVGSASGSPSRNATGYETYGNEGKY